MRYTHGRGRRIKARAIGTAVAATIVLVTLALVGTVTSAGAQIRPSRAAVVTPGRAAVDSVEAAVHAARAHDPIPGDLRPALSELGKDRASVGRCNYSRRVRILCRRGAVHSKRTIVVLGDSHARVWIPAVEAIANRTRYATYYLVKSGCPSATVTPVHGANVFWGCVHWRSWALGQIRNLRPDVLLLAGEFPPAVLGPNGAAVRKPVRVAPILEQGYITTAHRAATAGVGRILLLGDSPALVKAPGPCLSDVDSDLGTCASAPSNVARLTSATERSAARKSKATFVGTRNWFCAAGLCPAVVGTTITHRNEGHLTVEYTHSLNKALQAKLGLHRPHAG